MHDDLLGVVNHESGHAVAAYFKEFTFDQISVESPASYRGELDRVKFPRLT